ncbi:MAG TPA: hypothetical protein VES42_02280 [Pilimelia sp.]|nr:hypothetical protein [Pilimelia sp.]
MTRAALAAGLSAALVVPVAVAALAVPVNPAGTRQGSLAQVGPIAEHGFPAWYRDTNGLRLEACVTLDDPLCSTLPDEVPNPDQPVSYPDNFPGEFFYQLAGTEVTMINGVTAGIGLDLEGAWAAEEVREGDQMVFGRVRIRFDAPAGDKYRITHPYGIDEIVADDRGVNMTEDIGTAPGAFGGALASRIGPFLRWDPAVAPAAPAGYTGDPAVDHRVIGSPYNTNFVRIERLDATGAVAQEMGFTDLFSVQGRYATNAGVDLDQATYTVGPDGTGVVEVYATSEPNQSISISGNAALGFRGTRLAGQGGRYYGRFPVTGSVGPDATIEVVNHSDRPVTRKSRKLVDVVTVHSVDYDADAHTLRVNADSSDRDATEPDLAVTGFGPLTEAPFTDVRAVPAAITVTSSAGGSTTVPVTGSGAAFLPAAPIAGAVAQPVVVRGQRVALDGTGSAGEIDTYRWLQTGGAAVELTGADTASASFAAGAPGEYAFSLTVTGPGGQSAPAEVRVQVNEVVPIVANAGPDQTVIRGRSVALDASSTVGAETYAWTQVSGPAATLSNRAAAKPTFTYPVHALPAAPGPNAGFVYNNAQLVFDVTVTGPGGVATDRVVVRPQAETISQVTGRYRNRGEWRITGTSSLLAGQRVTVVLGSALTGRVIGTTTVDAAGAFALRATTPAPGTTRTISIVTSTGGRVLGAPITVTN